MDVQGHAEPLAQRGAVFGVARRGLAQPVVDVQRRHLPAQPDGEVEQADRVAAAGQQHEYGSAGGEQPALTHARLDAHR